MSHRVWKAALFLTMAAIMAGATTMHAEDKAKMDNPIVVMETTKGTLTIELYPDKAPETVKNFLWYVDHKFYDGLIFHRIIDNFVIQGGGFTKDLVKKQPNPPIKNEAKNGLKNHKYTLSMARTNAINSATSQFFINLKDNPGLDHINDRDRYGYAVFGKVVEGMELVDKIGKVQTGTQSGMGDVPVTPITMTKVYRSDSTGKEKEKKES